MAESVMLFLMGMACFVMAFALPVLPIVIILVTIGGVVKMIAKVFK